MDKHLALTYNHVGLVRHIKTPVELFTGAYDERKSHVLNATWDTGATCSVITPRIVQELDLDIVDSVQLWAVNSTHIADVSFVSLRFPHGAMFNDIRVRVCPITPNTDMLLGMDIINQLDLAICNGDGQTLFSFAIPPFKNKVNLSNWHE
jgi:hypothetical protein